MPFDDGSLLFAFSDGFWEPEAQRGRWGLDVIGEICGDLGSHAGSALFSELLDRFTETTRINAQTDTTWVQPDVHAQQKDDVTAVLVKRSVSGE